MLLSIEAPKIHKDDRICEAAETIVLLHVPDIYTDGDDDL